MRYAIILIAFGSFLCCVVACEQRAAQKKQVYNSMKSTVTKDTCDLYPSNGHDVYSKLGCINCHLGSASHSIDSSELSNYGEKQTLNLHELSKLDSAHIRRQMFNHPHRKLYEDHPAYNKLTDCEFSQMMNYFRHIDDIQY